MKFNRNLVIFVVPFVVLGLVLYFFHVPLREERYIFDWDQADDYEAVMEIVNNNPTLIGPRVTSDSGFFLAPWHYYYLLPFYLVTDGSLDMGFWGALVIQVFFTLISFLLAKKWFGVLAGMSIGLLAATSGTLVAWGFMYVPLFSIIFFYLCLETLKNPKLIPLLILFYGIGCSTYAVFYALGLPLIYVIVRLVLSRQVALSKIFLGISMATIPFFPLMVFDFRHDFLNLKNILNFANNQNGQGAEPWYFIKVFLRAVELFWLNVPTSLSISLVTLVIIGAAIYFLYKGKRWFLLIWMVSSLLPMAFYHGNVSEYYYSPVIVLIPFLVCGLLLKFGKIGKMALMLLLLIVIPLRFKNQYSNYPNVSLKDKIEVAELLNKLGSKYSVSYEFGLGQDSGYGTILSKLGSNYVEEGSAQLYTITDIGNTNISGIEVGEVRNLTIYKR